MFLLFLFSLCDELFHKVSQQFLYPNTSSHYFHTILILISQYRLRYDSIRYTTHYLASYFTLLRWLLFLMAGISSSCVLMGIIVLVILLLVVIIVMGICNCGEATAAATVIATIITVIVMMAILTIMQPLPHLIKKDLPPSGFEAGRTGFFQFQLHQLFFDLGRTFPTFQQVRMNVLRRRIRRQTLGGDRKIPSQPRMALTMATMKTGIPNRSFRTGDKPIGFREQTRFHLSH
mmetsp:Transcript_54016/g.62404  ORF Transcript_54016/g.62404 Transcript_54016/m.62404 type:complete len:233 (-) Transcript_54016:330-1028(-)